MGARKLMATAAFAATSVVLAGFFIGTETPGLSTCSVLAGLGAVFFGGWAIACEVQGEQRREREAVTRDLEAVIAKAIADVGHDDVQLMDRLVDRLACAMESRSVTRIPTPQR